MRAFHEILIPLFALSIAGCGGSVSGVGDRDAGPGPGDDANDTPPYDGGPVNPNCPAKSQVNDGYSCSLSGLVCPSSQTSVDCQGNATSLACFCDGEGWSCEQAPPPNCPVSTCPPPQSVYPGGFCVPTASETTIACSSKDVPSTGCDGEATVASGLCFCTVSGWTCPPVSPSCPPPPPPTCPDPYSVSVYQPCYANGLVCPGDPQNCEGDTYYDAFQCEGYWVPVATTQCNIGGDDASVGYPGIYDGAVGYPDAGYNE
jgi:hypothetical protein